MKTNEQMAADLKARGSALRAKRQRRGRIAAGVASGGAVVCLAFVVLGSGVFSGPDAVSRVGSDSGDARQASQAQTSAPSAENSAQTYTAFLHQSEFDDWGADATENDVCRPIILADTEENKGGVQAEEDIRGRAVISPALQDLIDETEARWGQGRAYYVVTVDFSACFDGEAASGFEYKGRTVAEYDAALQSYIAGLPKETVAVAAGDGQTAETVVSSSITAEQKQELAARKEALTAAKAAYARQWADEIAARLKAAGWEGNGFAGFAGADDPTPDDAALAEGQVRTILTAEQMRAVVCGEDEGILFLPASKIAGNLPVSDDTH